MNNRALDNGLTHASLRDGQSSDHPAGEIRLPSKSSVGRRAQLLAGLPNLSNDPNTIIDTISMSWG